MREIDEFSYHLGAADCFCEMVRAGVKRVALSHPCDTKEQRDAFLPEFERLCAKYGLRCYPVDQPLLTDLFPPSLNEGKFNVLFYRDEADLNEFLALRRERDAAVRAGDYDRVRRSIARRWGRLLSYPEEGIDRLLAASQDPP